MAIWNVRYYIDPETDSPHIYNHSITEEEVEEVLTKPGEDRQGYGGARVAEPDFCEYCNGTLIEKHVTAYR